MMFKQLSPTSAIMTSGSFSTISRRMIALLVAVLVIFTGSRLGNHDFVSILVWSLCATLSWHLLFAKRQININLTRGQISSQISSLYPIAKHEILIDSIKAIRLDKDPTRVNRYTLSVIVDSAVPPTRLAFGHQQIMTETGEKLASFCGKPLLMP